jgi:hypothetical protein
LELRLERNSKSISDNQVAASVSHSASPLVSAGRELRTGVGMNPNT